MAVKPVAVPWHSQKWFLSGVWEAEDGRLPVPRAGLAGPVGTGVITPEEREPSFSLSAELTYAEGQEQKLSCIDRQHCAFYIASGVPTVSPESPTAMNDQKPTVQGITPGQEVMTRQRLPYFIGGKTVNSTGLSMHLVVIPPGARAEPHIHVGYETGIYVLEGTVCTRWGAALEHEVVSQAGDFLFVPPGVPHEAINLSATEPARAVVARNHPAEQDRVESFVPELTSQPRGQEH